MLIDLDYLRGANTLAATGDVRYYLNGVLIEKRGADVFYVATDGCVLGVFHQALDPGDDGEEDFEIIVPADTARQCQCSTPPILGVLGRGPSSCTIDGARAGRLSFTPIQGRFPDWRRVIPAKWRPDHERQPRDRGPAQFNPDLVARLKRAVEIGFATGKKKAPTVTLAHYGPAYAALAMVADSDSFVGAIMPLRAEPRTEVPAWARSPVSAAAALPVA